MFFGLLHEADNRAEECELGLRDFLTCAGDRRDFRQNERRAGKGINCAVCDMVPAIVLADQRRRRPRSFCQR